VTDKNLEIKIPGAYSKLHRSEVDGLLQNLRTIDGRNSIFPRGKDPVGSSSTNANA